MRLRGGSFFHFSRICLHFSAVCLQFFKRRFAGQKCIVLELQPFEKVNLDLGHPVRYFAFRSSWSIFNVANSTFNVSSSDFKSNKPSELKSVDFVELLQFANSRDQNQNKVNLILEFVSL